MSPLIIPHFKDIRANKSKLSIYHTQKIARLLIIASRRAINAESAEN